jgi:hypothetical protein
MIVGVVTTISVLISWWCETNSEYPKIKFKAFKKFYSINPDRWTLQGHSVVCQIVNEQNSSYRGLFYTYENEIFYFTFFGYLRYKRFCKQLAKDKLNAKHMESTAKMLGMVKKDIANMEDLAEQQKKKAMENFDSILKNLK